MNRFTHFELVTDDYEKTAAFYRNVFGWQVQKWDGPVEYWLVTSGDTNTPGINGGLMKAGGPFSGTVNTLEVEDIDAALARVKANGGQIVFDKDLVPGVGTLAYVKDNAGIIIGIMQPLPGASM
jgi:predicted enzyme related to lactoylglutathione lyase